MTFELSLECTRQEPYATKGGLDRPADGSGFVQRWFRYETERGRGPRADQGVRPTKSQAGRLSYAVTGRYLVGESPPSRKDGGTPAG